MANKVNKGAVRLEYVQKKSPKVLKSCLGGGRGVEKPAHVSLREENKHRQMRYGFQGLTNFCKSSALPSM